MKCLTGSGKVSGGFTSGRTPRNGFTLVELVFAAAVVLGFAVIMLSALSRAWSVEDGAGCLDNLRKLGAGYQMYINEYDGWIPVAMGHGAEASWGLALSPYIDIALLECPADGSPHTSSSNAALANFPSGARVSYGYPDYFGTRLYWDRDWNRWGRRNESNIKDASKVLVLADADTQLSPSNFRAVLGYAAYGTNTTYGGIEPRLLPDGAGPVYRHGGGKAFNALLHDGSASTAAADSNLARTAPNKQFSPGW